MPQDIVAEAIVQGLWIARVCRLHEQDLVEVCPSIRLAVMVALSSEVCEGADVIRSAVVKMFANCK